MKKALREYRLELAHLLGVVLISGGAAWIYRPAGLIVLGAFIAVETWLYAKKD